MRYSEGKDTYIFIGPPPPKPKAAILLNGHFKLYKDLFWNFQNNLINPLKDQGYEIDIFFSCWNELSNNNSFSFKHANNFNAKYENFDLSDILDKYKPKKYFVGEYENYKHLFNILNYDPTLDLNTLHKDIHEGPTLFNLSQWFHRYQANQLKQQYEKENNFKYDLVISVRPDFFYLDSFPIIEVEKEKLNLRMLYSDIILVSSSEMNDKIDSLFLNIQNIINKYGRNKFEWLQEIYIPEHFLEYHLLDIGITKEHRKELGEKLGWLYPRSHDIATLYEICKKTNSLDKFNYVIDYFKLNG